MIFRLDGLPFWEAFSIQKPLVLFSVNCKSGGSNLVIFVS